MKINIISNKIEAYFSSKNEAREKSLAYSRKAIQHSGNAIRAIHRGEFEETKKLLAQAREALDKCEGLLRKKHPDIFYAGFVQDAQKEYAEAMVTYGLICDRALPEPEEINVGYPQYLNGLGEAVGEFRRHILDLIREGYVERGEDLLEAMDDIFYLLVSFDYPDAITYGLRRTADIARSIMEKTRGDLTTAIRQGELKQALKRLEEKLKQ